VVFLSILRKYSLIMGFMFANIFLFLWKTDIYSPKYNSYYGIKTKSGKRRFYDASKHARGGNRNYCFKYSQTKELP